MHLCFSYMHVCYIVLPSTFTSLTSLATPDERPCAQPCDLSLQSPKCHHLNFGMNPVASSSMDFLFFFSLYPAA